MKKFKSRIPAVILILSMVAVLLTTVSVYDFYHVLEKNEREIEEEILKDFAALESNVISTKLSDYINIISMSTYFLKGDALYTKENMDILKSISKDSDFHHMGIITLDGMLHSTLDISADISDRSYYFDIKEGRQSITGIKNSRITLEQVFVVAVPVRNSKGNIIGGIQATVSADDFQSSEGILLDVNHNCTYVIDRDGKYIVHSNSHLNTWDSTNFLENVGIKNGISMNDLKSRLQSGEPFSAELVISGSDCIAYFEPIDMNNWYTVVTIHDEAINSRIDRLLSNDVFTLLAKILITVLVLCSIIVVLIRTVDKQEQESEKTLRERLLSGIVGFMVVDLDEDRILRCSKGGYFQQFIDFPFSQSYNQILRKKVHPDYYDLVNNFTLPVQLRADFEKGITNNTISFMAYYINDEDSSWLECERHLFNDSKTKHLIVSYVLNDISERKLDEFILKTKAERDLLTGLYNRSAGTGIITQYLQSHKISNDTSAFLIVDLDNFKTLNDSLGHQTGDQALKDVGNILNDFFRKEDIVCRLGGDEFIVFVKNISTDTIIEKVSVLIKKLHLSYSNDEKSVTISASIGITIAPEHGTTFNELYKKADTMLYEVKESGKSDFKLYKET